MLSERLLLIDKILLSVHDPLIRGKNAKHLTLNTEEKNISVICQKRNLDPVLRNNIGIFQPPGHKGPLP